MINQYLFAAMLFFFYHPPSGGSGRIQSMQPKIRDTTELLSHRWLVTSIERAGKKTAGAAGSMALYMNFFSNAGFDFVGIGDGDLMIWKYTKGFVVILHKSAPSGDPEASFRLEKINAKTMQMSGLQAGVRVRYFLSHQPGD